MIDRRYKLWSLHLDKLVLILQGKLEVCGWPEDVVFISLYSNWHSNCVEIVLYSPSFDIVPEGAIPPYLEPALIEYNYVEVPKEKFGYSWLSVKANSEKLVKNDDPEQKPIKFREFI